MGTVELSERWFDDYREGDVFEVGSYAMETDAIITFAQEFDPQVFHVDPVAAADTVYGGLIASGWHTAAATMRLLAGTLGESSMGSTGGSDLRWTAPVRPGDVLSLRITVLETRPSTKRDDRGTVVCRNETLNQHGEVVMTFTPNMLLKRRGA